MSAFAQTTVTITGNADVGYRDVGVTNNTTKNVRYITQNNASTSALFFQASEELGGGVKAYYMGEADFSPVKVSLANAGTTNNGQWYTGGFFNGEQYVAISSATMGDLKLGAPNSPMLDVGANVSQPFGTALGGGYSDTFGRFGTSAGTGISGFAGNATTARVIRNERAVVYTSPTISGVTGQLEYAFKNGNGEASVSSTSTNGTTYASNNNGFFGVNLKYQNGPLTLAANSSKLSAGDVMAAGFYTAATTAVATTNKVSPGVIAAGTNVKYGMYAGNYQVTPDLTVYAGFTTTKTSNQDTASTTNTVEDSKSSNIAFKYVVGQYDLMLNRLNRTSNLAADAVLAPNGNAKLTGFGVNYNLSKMTYAYVRYEKASNVAVTGAGASANVYGDQSITAIGLRMKF